MCVLCRKRFFFYRFKGGMAKKSWRTTDLEGMIVNANSKLCL